MSKPRSPLTDADREQIEELAGRGLTSGQIAQRINKNHSTVLWFMYSRGLQAPAPSPTAPKSYVRNGRLVHRWTTEEDTFIQALRIQDFTLAQIAKATNARFNTQRSSHTVNIRLVMLAAREDAA